MLLTTVKNLHKLLLKQQQSFISHTTPHIRTIVRSTLAGSSLRLLLHEKHADGITLDGTIERLQTEFSAQITIPETNTDKRVLTISADKEQCVNVFKECLRAVHDPPYPVRGLHDHHQYEANFLVLQGQIGNVIGQAGVLLDQIEEETNVKVKVYRNCLPGSDERVVAVGGSEEEVVAAVETILDMLEVSTTTTTTTTTSGGTILYDPSSNDEKRKHIMVRNEKLATIIGRRGEGIIAIKQKSHALIDIATRQGRDVDESSRRERDINESLVSITGTPVQIRHAEYLLQQAVRDVHSSDVKIIQMKVAKDEVGAIIGTEGKTLSYLQHKSGAHITFEYDNITNRGGNRGDRILIIEGSPDEILQAQELIQIQLVRQERHKK